MLKVKVSKLMYAQKRRGWINQTKNQLSSINSKACMKFRPCIRCSSDRDTRVESYQIPYIIETHFSQQIN